MGSLVADLDRWSFWHRLPRPIIGLAPMDGVSDAAFRLIVARYGPPDVIFTEFTGVGDVCHGPEFLLESLRYHACERPVVAQLYGKDPELFYQAAHVVCELGFDGLDINMGCPARNVVSSGSGAGLIRTPERARAILRAARQGIVDWAAGQALGQAGLQAARAELVGKINHRRGAGPATRRAIPLSVKTRLGYDRVVIEEWVPHLLEAQPAAISIHGRTLAQMYRGSADWEAIHRARELVHGCGESATLVLGNGDLQSLSDVVRRVRETGVDGVLVGRGTLGSPWFFRHKEAARAACHREPRTDSPCRELLEEPGVSLFQRLAAMQLHARTFEALFGKDRFPRMRKHLGWYCRDFPHAAAVRADMVRASCSSDVGRIWSQYLMPRLSRASTDSVAEPALRCM
jgi:tRNA-dihydrouridine synthase